MIERLDEDDDMDEVHNDSTNDNDDDDGMEQDENQDANVEDDEPLPKRTRSHKD